MTEPPHSIPARTFILTGMPRSGTTYLAAVLHDPPRVVTMSEARGRWKRAWRDGADAAAIAELVREFHARIIRGEALPTFDGTAGYAGEGRVDTWNQAKIERSVPTAAGAAIGLKNPEVFLDWLPQLRALGLPVVITVRHPVGVINSWVRRGRRRAAAGHTLGGTFANGDATTFTATGDLGDPLGRCIELHEHFAGQIAAGGGDTGVRLVRYEDWFNDPAALPRLVAFLGLDGPRELRPEPVPPDPPDALDAADIDRILNECQGAAALGYPRDGAALAPSPLGGAR